MLSLEKVIELKRRHIDFIKKAKLNKQIGDLGELLALQYEKTSASVKYKDKISHDSKNIGDGLGYRIYNFDEDKNTGELFIIRGDLTEYCINPVQYEVVI